MSRFMDESGQQEKQTRRFVLGQCVRKQSGSQWHGFVVGFYETQLNSLGYVVESLLEPGSVQAYREVDLEPWDGKVETGAATSESLRKELVDLKWQLIQSMVERSNDAEKFYKMKAERDELASQNLMLASYLQAKGELAKVKAALAAIGKELG